jgi:hypothetical protein
MPNLTIPSEILFFSLRRTAPLLWLLTIAFGCSPSPAPVPTTSSSQTASVQAEANSPRDSFSKPPSLTASTEFHFRDATLAWKLDLKRFDNAQGKNLIQEANGGGVAAFDYDLDGRLDVFFTQGSRLPRKNITHEFSNEMFRNLGHLEKVTEAAGLISSGFHTGCVAGDVDEDGFSDLYVTAYGRSSLWHNNGDGTFSEISDSSRAVVDSWSTSAALADVNDDGLLDLFVVTYVLADDDPPKICTDPGSPTGTKQCPPTLFPAIDDVLLINDGFGGFVDVTREAGIIGRDGKGLGVVVSDLDGDAMPDIFVANDGTPCFLYKRVKDETRTGKDGIRIPHFEECAAEFGVAQNGEGAATAAMGIAHGDYDRDGWIDLFVTNFYLEANTLFRNLKGQGFLDVSASSRVGPSTRMTLGFGTEFLDVDHDGWLDLAIANGHIEDRTWGGQEPYKMRPHLFRNDRNGKFTDVAATAGPYFQSEWVGRGLAIGDLDRDGDLDLVVSHQAAPSALLLNETPTKATSIIIRPVGRGASPRSGIGTRVVAQGVSPVMMRDVAGGGSFQSASALELHLGLAGRDTIDELQLTWADGQIDRWPDVKEGYYIAIERRGIYKINSDQP